jgi:bifunctional oligoribonuclease and PAP phosphatase NrnA
MEKNSPKNIVDLIDSAQTIGFMTHIDGDGDAFGSMLALARIVETIGKKAVIFSNEPLLSIMDFMADDINYQPQNKYTDVDLIIGLDGNFIDRFTLPEVLREAKRVGTKLAIIDHHLLSGVGDEVDLYWGAPEISSASEMVYLITKEMNLKLDKTTATLILLGIETDTNSLQFENSKAEVFLAVADLLGQGARLGSVMDNAFAGKPMPMVKLLGRVIERMRITPDKIVISYVTLNDKEELGLKDKVSSGISNFLEQAKEGEVAIVFEEIEGGFIKASARSNNSTYDVARLANYLGGGGHKKAAAFKFEGTLNELIKL